MLSRIYCYGLLQYFFSLLTPKVTCCCHLFFSFNLKERPFCVPFRNTELGTPCSTSLVGPGFLHFW